MKKEGLGWGEERWKEKRWREERWRECRWGGPEDAKQSALDTTHPIVSDCGNHLHQDLIDNIINSFESGRMGPIPDLYNGENCYKTASALFDFAFKEH